MTFTPRLRAIVAVTALVAAAAITATVLLVGGHSPASTAAVSRHRLHAPVEQTPPGVAERTFRVAGDQRIIAFWNEKQRRTSASGSVPWVAYVHGGGWIAGAVNEPTALEFCRRMATLDITCFSLDYTRIPHALWPTQADQVAQQLTWVRRHGDVFHLDQKLGFTIGHSAGALMSGVAGLDDGHLAGTVSLAGATNAPWVARHDTDKNVSRDARMLVGGAPLDSARAQAATVIGHVNATTTRIPYLIVQETHDPAVSVSTSILLAGQLRQQGFPVTLDIFPGNSHQVNVSGPGVHAVDTWLQQRIAAVHRTEGVDTTSP